jgi:hypothetical protein
MRACGELWSVEMSEELERKDGLNCVYLPILVDAPIKAARHE